MSLLLCHLSLLIQPTLEYPNGRISGECADKANELSFKMLEFGYEPFDVAHSCDNDVYVNYSNGKQTVEVQVSPDGTEITVGIYSGSRSPQFMSWDYFINPNY